MKPLLALVDSLISCTLEFRNKESFLRVKAIWIDHTLHPTTGPDLLQPSASHNSSREGKQKELCCFPQGQVDAYFIPHVCSL